MSEMKISQGVYFLIFLTSVASCAIAVRQVKYSEMSSSPTIAWQGNDLIVRTQNSKENSSLLIYKIKSTVDDDKRIILLRGYQAVGKELKTEFKLEFKSRNATQLKGYKIYWVDPDGVRTELIGSL